ncbi:hypothetical protein [Bradyrhizobium sp. CCBAU 45384]|uniref:hypothetical protein n=1 Tax=Bradyrhizobium sp. CCBAU 45384 TaxID=858428 RepID=UPI0023063101|nr:hypothetical protein [Bradyrhizobium sp. CCBAU 45384]
MAEHEAVGVRDAGFEARSNPSRAFGELRRGFRWADLARGLLERFEPIGVDRQRNVGVP